MQQNECAMSWKAHSGEVYSVEFSCDENAVYSIGEDGKVGTSSTWRWPTIRELCRLGLLFTSFASSAK